MSNMDPLSLRFIDQQAAEIDRLRRVNGQFWVLWNAAGTYEAPTLLALIVEVLRHRMGHVLRGDGWVD